MSILYISSRKNATYFFYLAKNFLETSEKLTLRACGQPVATAVIVAEMLRDGGFIRSFACETCTKGEKTQVDVAVFRGGDHQDVPADVPSVVYVSQAKPPAFWAALVAKFLQSGPCLVSACGRCISDAMVVHEIFRQKNGFHVHPIFTRTLPKGLYLKTEARFEVNKL